jgi:hypothetical protein
LACPTKIMTLNSWTVKQVRSTSWLSLGSRTSKNDELPM